MARKVSLSSLDANDRSASHCRWGAVTLIAAIMVIVCFLPQSVLAAGTFIDAPARIDMVYDDSRDVLYISSNDSVLRYHIASKSFLSPFVLGGNLKGLDISPDGQTLAVADQSFNATDVWIYLVDLQTGQTRKVTIPRAFYEGGTFTVAFGNDGNLLISSTFLGSGWVPLRKFDLATNQVTELTDICQDTMLAASADGTVIGFAESNISDGRFGRYRVADGDILRKQWYEDGTGWFNYEIAVNRNGSQYAIPTYGGTVITDGSLVKYATVGQYAGGQPIGVVYHPLKDIVYFAWATTTQVRAFDSTTLTQVAEYDFENMFDHVGNRAFAEGRLKISRNGKFLFATVEGGIRFLDLEQPASNTPPVANTQSVATLEDTAAPITLTGSDAEGSSLTYSVVEGPINGTLNGTAPNLTYTPGPNYNGTDRFTFTVSDGEAISTEATVNISITPVNDSPDFSLTATSITVKPNSKLQIIPHWATNISSGPAEEASQTVSFFTTTNNPELFTVKPMIDSQGTLVFMTAHKQQGVATVTVYAIDSGGTNNGGVNLAAPKEFTITSAAK